MSHPAEELKPMQVERGNECGERNDDANEDDTNTNNNDDWFTRVIRET